MKLHATSCYSLNQFWILSGDCPSITYMCGIKGQRIAFVQPPASNFPRITVNYWPLMGIEQHFIVAHSCQHDQVLSHSHIICYLNQHHATASQDRQCLHLIQNNPNISKLKGAMTSLTIHKAHKGSTRLRERYATQVTGTRPSSLQ